MRIYRVKLNHPHYPPLDVTKEIEIHTQSGSEAIYLRAHNMGCSRDYYLSDESAIREFAREYGAKVESIERIDNFGESADDYGR